MKPKTVFITGASSGIGEALAREFAQRGFNLALCARRTDRLNTLADEFKKWGVQSLPLACDVTKTDSIKNAVQKTIETFGRLDITIANAGFGVTGYLEDLHLDDYKRQFDTNVLGVLDTIFQTLPEIKKNRGNIAIMGSVSSHVPFSASTPYSMSKFSVKALSLGLRQELKKDGVSVTLISPGFVDTEILYVNNHGVKLEEKKHKIPSFWFMPAEKAAKKMVKAILKGKRERIITAHGWIGVQLHRFFPSLTEKLLHQGEPERKK